jgi:hypothetical protein
MGVLWQVSSGVKPSDEKAQAEIPKQAKEKVKKGNQQ